MEVGWKRQLMNDTRRSIRPHHWSCLWHHRKVHFPCNELIGVVDWNLQWTHWPAPDTRLVTTSFNKKLYCIVIRKKKSQCIHHLQLMIVNVSSVSLIENKTYEEDKFKSTSDLTILAVDVRLIYKSSQTSLDLFKWGFRAPSKWTVVSTTISFLITNRLRLQSL